MRLGLRELTEQARAFPQLQRGRPSATVRATRFVTPEGVCANESLQPLAEGAARPYFQAPSDAICLQPALAQNSMARPTTQVLAPTFMRLLEPKASSSLPYHSPNT